MRPVEWSQCRTLAEAISIRVPAGGCVMPEPPSIFSGIDRDVYLVLDDFGRMGCAWREQTLKTAISKLSSKICGKASTATRFASLASMSPRVGFATCPKR